MRQSLRLLVAFVAVSALCAESAFAQIDTVRLIGGGTKNGKFKSMSKDGVVIFANSLDTTVPTNEIDAVNYASEPTDVKTARLAYSNGRYEDAKATLKGIVPANLPRDEIKHEVAYYLAASDAQIAMAGGEVSIDAAINGLKSFGSSYRSSYHFYETCEMLGNLSVRKQDFGGAMSFYGQLFRAPWPDFKMKAGVLAGRAAQTKGDHAAAINAFSKVTEQSSDSPEGKRALLAATLGKAVSETALDPTKAGAQIQIISKVINDASPEEALLHARAYNALGKCYIATGEDKEALMAFLHVDVVFNTNPNEHAEALGHLVDLWTKVGKADRSRGTREMLKSYYPNSKWAQR